MRKLDKLLGPVSFLTGITILWFFVTAHVVGSCISTGFNVSTITLSVVWGLITMWSVFDVYIPTIRSIK